MCVCTESLNLSGDSGFRSQSPHFLVIYSLFNIFEKKSCIVVCHGYLRFLFSI